VSAGCQVASRTRSQLQWMIKAIGIEETPGAADNPDILRAADVIAEHWPDMAEYCATYIHDSTPWCGLAAAWGVTKANIRPPVNEFLASSSWRKWGFDVKGPEFGAIACLDSHVAFVYDTDGSTVHLLGGNQSDMVNIIPVAANTILTYRWPAPEDYRVGYYPEDDRK
jgi:uncharacterized protein (TIGR02594 family)